MIYYKFTQLEPIYYFCEIDYVFKTEQWKDVVDYEGLYMASDLGRVKSINKTILKSNGVELNIKGKILKFYLDEKGYNRITISKNGKIKNFMIHHLISMSFFNVKRNGYKLVVDHIKNNPLDNRLLNLQLITQRENTSKDKRNKNYSSFFTGVSWCKQTDKWKSSIRLNGVNKTLGRFLTEIEASNAYQKALQLYNQEIVC